MILRRSRSHRGAVDDDVIVSGSQVRDERAQCGPKPRDPLDFVWMRLRQNDDRPGSHHRVLERRRIGEKNRQGPVAHRGRSISMSTDGGDHRRSKARAGRSLPQRTQDRPTTSTCPPSGPRRLREPLSAGASTSDICTPTRTVRTCSEYRESGFFQEELHGVEEFAFDPAFAVREHRYRREYRGPRTASTSLGALKPEFNMSRATAPPTPSPVPSMNARARNRGFFGNDGPRVRLPA